MYLIILVAILFYFFRKKNPADELAMEIFHRNQLSQIFLSLGVLFFGLALFALNQYFNRLVPGSMLLLATVILGFIIAYYFQTRYLLTLSLAGLLVWWSVELNDWLQPGLAKRIPIFAGLFFISIIFFVVGRWHAWQKKFLSFTNVYLLFSFLIITCSLGYFSLRAGMESLAEMSRGASFLVIPGVLLMMLLVAGLSIGLIIWAGQQKILLASETWILALFCILGLVLALLPEQTTILPPTNRVIGIARNELTSAGFYWVAIFNLLAFFELLGMIWIGFLRHQEWLINLSIVSLFLLILIKYFDWFFSFLDKSVFFIGVGVIFLLIGLLMERGRRYIISTLKYDQTS